MNKAFQTCFFAALACLFLLTSILLLRNFIIEDLEQYVKYRQTWKKPLRSVDVPEDELHDCMGWAFGEKWKKQQFRQIPSKWNELHEDIFTMYGSDCIEESLMRVGKAYLNATP